MYFKMKNSYILKQMEIINSSFNNLYINKDIYYDNLYKRLNWNFEIFIYNEDNLNNEYIDIYRTNLNHKINTLIKEYINFDARKGRMKDKYHLMLKIDYELLETWD